MSARMNGGTAQLSSTASRRSIRQCPRRCRAVGERHLLAPPAIRESIRSLSGVGNRREELDRAGHREPPSHLRIRQFPRSICAAAGQHGRFGKRKDENKNC
uniref:Uncharacterized protein n=1 Tax=Oryza punctata TaxID=4537 RepID=A0A0E0KCA9_ORYPU